MQSSVLALTTLVATIYAASSGKITSSFPTNSLPHGQDQPSALHRQQASFNELYSLTNQVLSRPAPQGNNGNARSTLAEKPHSVSSSADKERPAKKQRLNRTTLGKRPAEVDPLTPEQRLGYKYLSAMDYTESRRDRNQVLGLNRDSPMPLFAQQLTVDQVKGHPSFNEWHQHREAMQRGRMRQDQLPVQLKTARGKYLFPQRAGRRGKKPLKDVVQDSELSKKRSEWHRTRYAKLKELGLDPKSAVPEFAKTMSLEALKDHPEINNWHEHRMMVEDGRLKKEKFPPQFTSIGTGKVIFQKKDKRQTRPSSGFRAPLTEKKGKTRMDHYLEHYAKTDLLGLRKDSALPIFAHGVPSAELVKHDQIASWNQHRSLLEKGKITQQQLPPHFRAQNRNQLLKLQVPSSVSNQHQPFRIEHVRTALERTDVREAPSHEQVESLKSALNHEKSQDADMLAHFSPLPQQKHAATWVQESRNVIPVHPESNSEVDPFAFLHHMLLD